MLKPQSGNIGLIILMVILLIGVGAGGYYLGTQKNSSNQAASPETPISSPLASSSLVADTSTSIPQGWTYQKNESCSVQIPIPPKAEPYTTTSFPENSTTSDNNRYWHLLENTESEMVFFKDDALTFFTPLTPSELGNDYNPGSVYVFCTPNPDNLNSLAIPQKLAQEFVDKKLDFKIFDQGSENKWGIDTKKITIEGGMFGDTPIYLFSANGKMYFVYSVSNSTNQPVKDVTKQIFNNLKFSN